MLGPLLFRIHINDLCEYTTIPFADDTDIFLNGMDLKQMQIAINEKLTSTSKC